MKLRRRLDRLEAARTRDVAHGSKGALAAAMPVIIRGARPLPIGQTPMLIIAQFAVSGHFLSSL